MADSTRSPGPASAPRQAKPEWLRVRAPGGPGFERLMRLVRSRGLHTVCESAHCPNMGECWERGTATFMILGDVCTRSCRFCAVKTGRPTELDLAEPERVADAVRQMGISHAVITSVNRDELSDGGADIFRRTILAIRQQAPDVTVEVLIPDFRGSREALATVMSARPEVLNHNVETVPRLYPTVRPQAKYPRSLDVIRNAKDMDPEVLTKSGLMVGLGETYEEVLEVMRDLRNADCDILTVGQYLRPTLAHLPVERYWHPEEFGQIREEGLAMGFLHVESGPLVRSSYHAEGQVRRLQSLPRE
ncbi:MAG: lipoyl synthase [Armatimonadota bacterium]